MILSSADISLATFRDDACDLTYPQAVRLLDVAARELECPEFGMLLAPLFRLRSSDLNPFKRQSTNRLAEQVRKQPDRTGSPAYQTQAPAMLGFKSPHTAAIILGGIELTHMIRKDQMLRLEGHTPSLAGQFNLLAVRISIAQTMLAIQ